MLARHLAAILLHAILLLTIASPCQAGGKLDRVREETSSRDDDNDDDDDDDDDDDGGGFLGALLRGLFSGPERSDGASPSTHERPAPRRRPPMVFMQHPYAEGYGGNLVRTRAPDHSLTIGPCPPDDLYCPAPTDTNCEGEQCFALDDAAFHTTDPTPKLAMQRLQLTTEFGTDVDGLYRYTFGLWLESVDLIGFETRFTNWLEPLATGQTDQLLIGDANLVLRVSETESLQAHLGAGARLLFDPQSDDGAIGFNGTVSVESYPLRPLALRGSVDIGHLGPAFFGEAQASLGAMLYRFELFAGYSGTRIGSVLFHGPLAGLRLHL